MKPGCHVPEDVRHQILDDIDLQRKRTGIARSWLLKAYGLARSTYYDWCGQERVAEPARRNVLRILDEEKQAVIEYRTLHAAVGYRKLTWMMNDEGVVALSESTVYQILKANRLLSRWEKGGEPSGKEYREKPGKVHEHWHIDIAYVKIRGIFYFLVMMLDGYSRYILDWELMTDMLGSSVEDFVVRVREKYPGFDVKLISDNGPQFVSRDFKVLLSKLEIQHCRTRRNHPETNGKIERLNGSVRQEALRLMCPSSYHEAQQVIGNYVDLYNNRRLHAGIRYLRPVDMFEGRDQAILEQRGKRFVAARATRIVVNKARYASQSRSEKERRFEQ